MSLGASSLQLAKSATVPTVPTGGNGKMKQPSYARFFADPFALQGQGFMSRNVVLFDGDDDKHTSQTQKPKELTDEEILARAEKIKGKTRYTPRDVHAATAKYGSAERALEEVISELNASKEAGFRAQARQELTLEAETSQLKADKQALTNQVTELTKDRDGFKTKYEGLVSEQKQGTVKELFEKTGAKQLSYMKFLLKEKGYELDAKEDKLILTDTTGKEVPYDSVVNTEFFTANPVVAPSGDDPLNFSPGPRKTNDDAGAEMFVAQHGRKPPEPTAAK